MTDFGLSEETLDVLRRRYLPRADFTKDPQAWLAEKLPNIYLWSKQLEILKALSEHRNVAVKSGHGLGKSFLASVAVFWWLDSHQPGSAFAVTSAPTGDQVTGILWRELGRRHAEGNFGGRINMRDYHDASGELVALGRKTSDYNATSFQGIHAEHLLVVLDEACGISNTLWEGASTLTSTEGSRTLAIGNPDDPQSEFRTVCEDPDWHTITISVFDSPNFTSEEIPERLAKVLTSVQWVDERKRKWGEKSPLYISKVLAEFPTDATDGVIPFSWLSRARYHELLPEGEIEAGLDVAAGGADRAVLWIRQGPRALERRTLQGETDPLALATWVEDALVEYNVSLLKVDSIGVGWAIGGIIDDHHAQGFHNCVVAPVNVSESADKDDEFFNLRAEIWWTMRELCRLQLVDLSAIDDDDANELTCVRYHRKNARTRIQIEKKDEVKKRLGRSPDLADALLLAYHVVSWEPDVSGVEYMTQARLPRLT